ncbi:MAG: hypothetical protein CR965_01735 [Paludibacter sp.]|nr:MAG: hypothetical protein CR965_01735 [Paludibacter sp.]
MKIGITLLILILLTISCSRTIQDIKTEHYTIKIKEAKTSKKTSVSYDNINRINAKKIKLKELFTIIPQTSSDNIIKL